MGGAVTFPVQTLQFREKLHVFNLSEAFVMEVQLFVELESAVVHFPFLFEKFENPFLCASAGAIFIKILIVVGSISPLG